MKKQLHAAILVSCLAMSGCAGAPPSQIELAQMSQAPMPSSQKAAESAIKAYFDQTLIDPDSARYTLRKPVRGALRLGPVREFGIFVCGTINSKNRMGGYTGRSTFLAYFDPHVRDRVQDASIDQSVSTDIDFEDIWCNALYGS